jgi:hypothetical protein
LFWLGLLVGVSFVAAPVKFNAASLSLPVALDVGRATFSVFNNIEWVMFTALVATIVLSGPSLVSRVATLLLAAVLLLQSAWLLPVLNQRIAAIIAGHDLPSSPDHLYILQATSRKPSCSWQSFGAKRSEWFIFP